jgi:hypothetical protein
MPARSSGNGHRLVRRGDERRRQVVADGGRAGLHPLPATGGVSEGCTEPSETGEENVMLMVAFDATVCARGGDGRTDGERCDHARHRRRRAPRPASGPSPTRTSRGRRPPRRPPRSAPTRRAQEPVPGDGPVASREPRELASCSPSPEWVLNLARTAEYASNGPRSNSVGRAGRGGHNCAYRDP